MRSFRILFVVAVLLLVSVSAFAQTTGTLTGTVTTDGNPLPGATVTASSPSAQGTRTAVTDSNGNYNIPGLAPGDYTVRVELSGMAPVTRTARVSLSGTARLDADLKVSAVAEAITVTASAPAVLETTEVQTNIKSGLIEDLPIGRTLLATVNLAPGVNNTGVGGATTISGGFAFDSTYYVDGAVVNELLRGQPQNLFIEDAIQETTVQTGGVSAEFGRFTGGVVTAISKSGGNEFSGSFRDSVTNPKWTAKGEKAGTNFNPTDKIFNTYEATFGGRIVRDRLWFFTAGRSNKLDYERRLGSLPGDTKTFTYPYADKETRIELKLTGQLSANHSLNGSVFDIKREQKNNPFGTPLETSALDASRELPNRFFSVNYNGVLASNFLLEAQAARQTFEFVNSGADNIATPERGTNIYYASLGQWAGYPTFCSGCASFPESRNNNNAKLKGTYFASTGAMGSHNIVGGLEYYEDMLKSDNYQSASSFTMYSYDTPKHTANGELLHTLTSGNGFFIWYPILQSSQGNSFKTTSGFVNDKWDLNRFFSFNVGARYDKNNAENQTGVTVADDSKISPRLGVTYDVFGNGRLRATATYSQYSSKIANGNVGDVSSSAGSPSYLYWLYYGDDLIDLPRDQFLDKAYAWFRGQGFTKNTDFLLGGGTAGLQTQIDGVLKSPGMDEWTIGAGTQLGTNGFVRVDYQNREWNNFYTNFANTQIGKVFDPLVGAAGANVDLTLVKNSDDFVRTYNAVLAQGSYRLFNRVNLGANYTWSKLEGNYVGESSGGGPGAAGGSKFFPEFYNYAKRNPEGFLTGDQRHKARGWASYDLATPIGRFNFSLLHRFDSGVAYSAAGNVYVEGSGRCTTCRKNAVSAGGPGYTTISGFSTNTYFFSDRGAFRTDDIQATDFALNYALPLGRAELFIQGELLNSFNNQGATNVNTTIRTATTSACVQNVGANTGKRCAAFNPFTETPVEGVNWRKGPNFGKPVSPTSGELIGGGGDFQTPRTYRFSLGARF